VPFAASARRVIQLLDNAPTARESAHLDSPAVS
jgi:hypothetical protein